MRNSACAYYWNLSSHYQYLYALLRLKTGLQEKDVKTLFITHDRLF